MQVKYLSEEVNFMRSKAYLEEIIKEVTYKVKDILGDKLYKIILYGSYARGDYDESSDIDIMVLVDISQSELTLYRKKVNKIASRIGLHHDIMISVTLKDKESFYNYKELLPFYQNVIRDGVEIYGY